ncbi:hypothetical protein KCP75_20295 [Salmonella enterica subsp. enterica]|nr:hypothetical protein KCP75_20295 [Salmonella enterica subsp. enterica]
MANDERAVGVMRQNKHRRADIFRHRLPCKTAIATALSLILPAVHRSLSAIGI